MMKNINKMKLSRFYSFFYFVLCTLYFVLLTCSKNSTNPQTVTFSGTVTLEGKTDHSGVKVSLYKPVELDTALVRINQQYPNIGVQISQETEFDHREHTPVKSTTTNASGSWKIEGVEPGTYNVVAEKDSFGWQTKYGSNNSNNLQINLSKLIVLNKNKIIESNENYLIVGDLELMTSNINPQIDNTTLYLENNSILSFKDLNRNIRFINCKIYAGSNSEIYFINNNQEIFFEHIQFQFFKKIVFNNLFKLKIGSSIFCQNESINVQHTENLEYSNVLFVNNSFNEIFNCNSSLIFNSVIYNNPIIGIEISHCSLSIEDCLFKYNERAMFCSDQNMVNLRYSDFIENKESIYFNNNFDGIVENCNFRNSFDIFRLKALYGYARPIINLNNFYNTQRYVIHLDHISDSIDVTKNYWETNNNSLIQDKIYDYQDNNLLGSVIFQPILSLQNDSAGVRDY